MNNIFPIYENVSIEEVYGNKRPNAQPPTTTKTFVLLNTNNQNIHLCCESVNYDWFNRETISDFEKNSFYFLHLSLENGLKEVEKEYLRIRNSIIDLYKTNLDFITLTMAYREVKGSFSMVSKIHSFLER